MKKSVLSAVLLLVVFGVAAAQSVTGRWSCKSPAAVVEGVDFGSKMANAAFSGMMKSAVKREVGHDLDSLGFGRGASLTLEADGSFRMSVSEGFVTGSYVCDTAVGSLTLTAGNGHSSTGRVEFDGSKMNLLFTLGQFSDFMILVSLARYKGAIPDAAMADIRAAQEKTAGELKELEEGIRQLGDKLKETGSDGSGDINREEAERMARAIADMKIYMGVVFGK